MRDAKERFKEKYIISKNGCWVWNSPLRPDGYGQFSFEGLPRLAHRWSYEQTKGNVPEGLELDHLCRNRACVNPDHLEAVTRTGNTKRGNLHKVLRARWKKITHCPQGHPYNKRNTYISKAGTRACKMCKLESQRRRRKAAVGLD